MLLRETLISSLASPAATVAPKDEVSRHFQPDWKASASSHALVLTGVRRCGKSTLQAQIRRGIMGSAVTLNLEDTRLYGLGPEDFVTLLSILDTDYPKAAVYLDEVQEVPEWQRLVRALLDTGHVANAHLNAIDGLDHHIAEFAWGLQIGGGRDVELAQLAFNAASRDRKSVV